LKACYAYPGNRREHSGEARRRARAGFRVNEWLTLAPDAQVAHGRVGCFFAPQS